MTAKERIHTPGDYARDWKGRVSVQEMNRHLPRWRCSVCGQWLYRDELHRLEDCAKRVNLGAEDAPA